MADRAKAGVEAVRKRIRVNQIVCQLSNDNVGEEERASLLEEKKKLVTSIKTKEKNSRRAILDGFEDKLEQAVTDLNESATGGTFTTDRGGTVAVIHASHQADSCIARRRVEGLNDLIESADSDFAVYGGSASIVIVIKAFAKTPWVNTATKEKTWSLKDFVVYSPTAVGLDEVITEAQLSATASRRKAATYPIFDACSSPRMQALVAIGIGCDQHPGGALGVGPAKMLKQIQALKAADVGSAEGKAGRVEEAIATWLDAESDSGTGVHATLADSLLFEPANEAGSELSYIGGTAPASLESYLSEMAADDTTITSNLETATCPGPCHGNSHKFLVAEGKERYCCSSCSAKVCRFCFGALLSEGEGEAIYSGPCYSSNAIMPGGGISADISIHDMKSALTRKGVEGIAGIDDPDVIEDLYAEHIESNKPDVFDSSKVKFPLLQSKELPDLSQTDFDDGEQQSTEIKVKARFDWHTGGCFIGSDGLTACDRADLIILANNVLTMSDATFDKKYQKDLAGVLPKLVVDFARDSRLDGSWRLMYRAIRGALDKRCPSIMKSTGAVVEHNGDVGFQIDGKIRASMKGKAYDGSIAFTSSSLLAGKCACKAGSEGDGRSACVHTMCKLYQLYVLLIDGLAEHLVYELAEVWNGEQEAQLDNERKGGMVEALRRLVSVAGLDEVLVELSPSELQSASGILSRFVVGTEQRKLAPPPADPLALGPFRLLKGEIKSLVGGAGEVAERAKKKIKLSAQAAARKAAGYVLPDDAAGDTSSNSGTNTSSGNEDEAVDYNSVLGMVNAIVELHPSSTPRKLTDCVGYTLLEHRASDLSPKAKRSLKESAKKRLKQLEIAARSQSPPKSRSATSYPQIRPSSSPKAASPAVNVSTPVSVSASPALSPSCPSPEALDRMEAARKAAGYSPPSVLSAPRASKRQNIDVKGSCSSCLRPCYFVGCTCHAVSEVKWTRVPKKPSPPTADASDKVKKTYVAARMYHAEFCDRIGRGRTDPATDKRICSNHAFVTVKKYVHYLSNSGKMRRVCVEMNVPDNDGAKALANVDSASPSKGIASDRANLNAARDLEEQIELGGSSKEVAELKKLLQQVCEVHDDEDLSLISEAVRKQFGLDIHACAGGRTIGTSKLGRTDTLLPASLANSSCKSRKRNKLGSVDPSIDRSTTVIPAVTFDVSDDEVHRLTNFSSLQSMLAYVAVVCNGDADEMTKTVTKMTWFEEWFCYFEVASGAATTRLRDAGKKYGSKKKVKTIYRSKIAKVLQARRRWPTYATMEEDAALRDPKWNARYSDQFVIMWDNTNLNMSFKPSDAEVQSNTFSCYYNGNVGKGGVHLQPCGWLGSHELWMGAVSDTEYFQRSGILEQQVEFVGDGTPVTNVLDRGYRSVRAAMKAGKQRVLQPPFAPSDRKFNTHEIISMAAIASDRSGNERAVKICKSSGHLKRGLDPAQDIDDFADTWLAWSFQTNFMYKRVL
mmetsp:Transcript_12290/g.35170  ORF Transcript_12290/g.35170 Transcript_12290/m.35170 type:complete len:1472 (+) Transcript_12290:520-4935(+)